MVITLALVFRPPLRLLPLAIALGASGVAFGLLSLVGGSLTMASIAVLPVLMGLSVDYAIQFQARFDEAVRRDPRRPAPRSRLRRGRARDRDRGARDRRRLRGPGAVADPDDPRLRPAARDRDPVAFALAVTVGLAVLSLTPRGETTLKCRVGAGSSGRGGSDSGDRLGALCLGDVDCEPGRVLAAALVLAVAGWGAGTQTG